MPKRRRTKIEQEVDRELEAETKEELVAEFDQSQALHVPAKKSVSKLISIRLPVFMMKELRDLAVTRGDIGYQQLIKIFIADGLLKSKRETTSLAVTWPSRFRAGDWSNLGSSFSAYYDFQPSTSRTGDPLWK